MSKLTLTTPTLTTPTLTTPTAPTLKTLPLVSAQVESGRWIVFAERFDTAQFDPTRLVHWSMVYRTPDNDSILRVQKLVKSPRGSVSFGFDYALCFSLVHLQSVECTKAEYGFTVPSRELILALPGAVMEAFTLRADLSLQPTDLELAALLRPGESVEDVLQQNANRKDAHNDSGDHKDLPAVPKEKGAHAGLLRPRGPDRLN